LKVDKKSLINAIEHKKILSKVCVFLTCEMEIAVKEIPDKKNGN
jgi:hypothetical protein